MSEDLGLLAEKISKQALKDAGSEKPAVFSRFTKLINDRLKNFGEFKKSDFVVDDKGSIVSTPSMNTAYSTPQKIKKVNAKGQTFEVNNPAYQTREALHKFMKEQLIC